jgi:hypothetical protein
MKKREMSTKRTLIMVAEIKVDSLASNTSLKKYLMLQMARMFETREGSKKLTVNVAVIIK